MRAVSPCIFAPEKVNADEDAPVVTKRIDAAVVSTRIVEAEEREKRNFSKPDEGAEIVKLLSVAVPEEKYDIPCAARTAPDELINSTALLTTI